MNEPLEVKWRKSSRSSSSGNDCVEVAVMGLEQGALVRDTKDPDGGTLQLGRGAAQGLLDTLRGSSSPAA
jgi:hypothetical protein